MLFQRFPGANICSEMNSGIDTKTNSDIICLSAICVISLILNKPKGSERLHTQSAMKFIFNKVCEQGARKLLRSTRRGLDLKYLTE